MAGEPTHYTAATNFGANVLTDVYLQKKFITRLENELILTALGKQAQLPEGMGKTVRWNLLSNPAALAAASEGTPTSVTLTTATVTATLLDYVSNYTYSKFLELTATPDTIPEIVSAAGYQMALTFDTVCNTSALTDATQIDSGTALTLETVRQAVAAIEKTNARPHPATPGGAFYCGTFTAEQLYDMFGEGAPTWVQAKRGDLEAAMAMPMRNTTASSAVYNVILKKTNVLVTTSEEFGYVFGNEAYGVAFIGPSTPLSPQVYVTPPSARVDRAARDQGSIGSIGFFAAEMLDAARIREIKSDVT